MDAMDEKTRQEKQREKKKLVRANDASANDARVNEERTLAFMRASKKLHVSSGSLGGTLTRSTRGALSKKSAPTRLAIVLVRGGDFGLFFLYSLFPGILVILHLGFLPNHSPPFTTLPIYLDSYFHT